jgi:hypothetical protein
MNRKLTPHKEKRMREIYATGLVRSSELARIFFITPGAIRRVVNPELHYKIVNKVRSSPTYRERQLGNQKKWYRANREKLLAEAKVKYAKKAKRLHKEMEEKKKKLFIRAKEMGLI